MATFEAGRCCIRRLRINLGMTQEQLADLSGVPRTTLSSLENNRYVLKDLGVARSIAQPLQCHIDDLYDWTRVQ